MRRTHVYSIVVPLVVLAIAVLSLAAQRRSQAADPDASYVGDPAATHPQSNAAAQDGTTLVTNPATGEVYRVRSHNAPAAQHAAQARTVAATRSATGLGRTPIANPQGYFQWQDPAESAFRVSLPRGWQVSGGTQRTTRIEPHYVIRAQSPTGGVQMFMDDPQIAIRQVPNGFYGRKGQVIPSAWGGRLLVARYTPAPAVAQQYARARMCPSASNFQGGIIQSQTASLGQEFGALARAEGKQLRVDVGEASFKCGEQDGYVYAITVLVWQPGQPVSLWVVYRIAGYTAQPQESALAADAMHNLLGSFEMNQGWLQRFAQESQDMAGNVIRESNAVTQSTIARAKQQDAESEQRFKDWQNNSNANFNAIEHTNQAITGSRPGGSAGNGHDYNAQLGTKTVCDDLDRCQSVDASVDTWYSNCAGEFTPGNVAGGAPPASTSACWNMGH